MNLEFEIPGRVKAKQSFKIGRNGIKYTPSDIVEYANFVKFCFLQSYPGWNIAYFHDSPLQVCIDVYFAIPKSFSKKKQEMALCSKLKPAVKPDCDNCAKVINDALNGIAFYDDKQIANLLVRKWYDTTERVVVRIGEV